MKILFFSNDCHHKIKLNLIKSLELNNHIVTYSDNINLINDHELIYSPCIPINVDNYPTKKFIFGPQFSILPDNKSNISCKYNNAIYIQPSVWVVNLWKACNYKTLPLKSYPVGIDTELFKPVKSVKDKILVYYKQRSIDDYNFIINRLKLFEITNYVVIKYGEYKESDFIKLLNESKYVIWIDAHESQGIALGEALSMDVPLLVWNVINTSQEIVCNWDKNLSEEAKSLVTTIPYWDEKCGEYFYKKEEFDETFNRFLSKLDTYKPREYILENLTLEKQGKEFVNLI